MWPYTQDEQTWLSAIRAIPHVDISHAALERHIADGRRLRAEHSAAILHAGFRSLVLLPARLSALLQGGRGITARPQS